MDNQRNDVIALAVLSFLGGVIVTLAISNSINAQNELERAENPPISACEYQFIVEDSSIVVKDFERYVGTVKIEGQLEKLINDDNE
jgi:hypothetical protein